MDLEDKYLAKVSTSQSVIASAECGEDQMRHFSIHLEMSHLNPSLSYNVNKFYSLSSSVHSTPEKNGHSDDASGSPDLLQEFLKSISRKDLLRSCFDKEKKRPASSKAKMTESMKNSMKLSKNQEQRKASSTSNNYMSNKQQRKGGNPIRLAVPTEQSREFGDSNSWICKNSACRAVLSIDDTFCRRCSCCICHLFDDNKDPSLWLECTSESGQGDSCGLSCHIECAIQSKKVGVVNLGQLMQLDGSYCCAWCGKVSGSLGFWKKQLVIAKDARRVDILCYRIFLCFRLFDGTSRFKEMHEILRDAKDKLEAEVGPLNGISSSARGIVSRLSIASDVQKLCSLAIEKADDWLSKSSKADPNCREDSLPAACRFLFQDVSPSSVVIVLIELSNPSSDNIKGYKLWYYNSKQEKLAGEPISVLPRTQRRILISNLQPCTEYTFRVISYTESGDLGHSEAKCFTKSVEIIHKKSNSELLDCRKDNSPEGCSNMDTKTTPGRNSSECKVRDLGKVLRLAWAQEEGSLGSLTGSDKVKCCGDGECHGANKLVKPEKVEDQMRFGSRGELDLNVVSVPDLNEELPPYDCSRDEENGCTLGQPIEADDDAVSHQMGNGGVARCHGSGDNRTWALGQALHSQTETCRKRSASMNEEAHESDSTLIDAGSPIRNSNGSVCLDENFEYCVKIIRWLECEGLIKQEFRLKLLTWYSLRSSDQERRVVNTFIQTLIDDPSSLAAQLVDSFTDIISHKRPRNGFSNKLQSN